MDVLVTGGHGYAGSVLLPKLKGHDVTNLDSQRFGKNGSLEGMVDIEEDLRSIPASLESYLINQDVVIHLAATSKEPTSLYDTKYCLDTNYCATKDLVKICKETDTRLIYACSTSVYFTYDLVDKPNFCQEEKTLNPISPYSITKYASEQTIRENLDDYVILRPGTHYGVSPRMRLDLVVNTMTKYAYDQGEIFYKEGIYRPLVDVETITDAYAEAVDSDQRGTYNVLDFNISLRDLAYQIADIVPTDVTIDAETVDVERNYRADESKFQKDFETHLRGEKFEDKVMEIWEWCQNHDITQDKFYNTQQ